MWRESYRWLETRTSHRGTCDKEIVNLLYFAQSVCMLEFVFAVEMHTLASWSVGPETPDITKYNTLEPLSTVLDILEVRALDGNQVMENPVLPFTKWCIVRGCFPQIADHIALFSVLFSTRRAEQGTGGSIVPPRGKVFVAVLKQLDIPRGKLSVEEGFPLPLVFYDFKFLSAFKGGGCDDLGWACECALNDRTDGGAAPSYQSKVRTFLSTALNLHCGCERGKRLTLAAYSSKLGEFIGFLTVKLL